jgi:hypothetical protein
MRRGGRCTAQSQARVALLTTARLTEVVVASCGGPPQQGTNSASPRNPVRPWLLKPCVGITSPSSLCVAQMKNDSTPESELASNPQAVANRRHSAPMERCCNVSPFVGVALHAA